MSDENLGLETGDGPLQPAGSAQADSPGKILAAKRQELNWTVEDVAHSLHLAPRQVQAIEADNYGALPGIAVTRGFVRSYAKLLKCDPAPLLENITDGSPDIRTGNASLRKALPAKPFYAHPSMSMSKKPWSRAWIALGVVLVCSVAALLIAWKSGWLPTVWLTGANGLLSEQAERNTARPSQAQPEAETALEQLASAPALVSEQVSDSQGANASAPPAAPTSELQGAASQGSAAVQDASSAEQKDALVLKLREDSWIEIRDASNKVLISRLVKAGESESIPVTEPLKLVIGNAAGVDAQLRGAPMELNASAKSNVARLTVN